ncbi:hypothetical protein D6779_04595 [Candidatus Parcubacteria bacterium]|nr:MAG: hypothetical protein D6779_04595 [Candidatus Parcubacteria bacterium]
MHNPNLPVGYALMFVFTAIVSGVMLFSVGILGEYVGRVYISLSKRPQFIIRKAAKAKRTLEQQVR